MAQLDIFSLHDRVALICGGGGAIGAAMAEAFAGAGARVTVSGRTPDSLAATVDRVKAAGSDGFAVVGDATSEADAERMVAETLKTFGRLDIIVNAVGGGAGEVLHPAEEYPRDAWDWIMELNVRSTVIPTQAAVRAMIAAGHGGAVLNITSVRADARDQRRLLGLRRREGRDRVADPPVGDRMGEARHPGERDHADVRRHAAGRDAPRRPGSSRPASSTGSRSGGSARRATSSARRSSSAPTPRRS